MSKNRNYIDSVHTIGRLGTLGSMAFMLGIPAVICQVYGLWPSFGDVMRTGSGVLAMFIPVAISEVFSYTPILGSAAYIAFITGNVLNLKLPCAINAMEIAEVTQGTEEGDAISTVAIASSSMITMVVIAIGVVLLVPLQPILSIPSVQVATTYMLPALMGGMFLNMVINKNAGEYVIEGKLKTIIIPLLVVVAVNYLITPISGKEGFAMLFAIPFTVLCAKVLYDKGMVKVLPLAKPEPPLILDETVEEEI